MNLVSKHINFIEFHQIPLFQEGKIPKYQMGPQTSMASLSLQAVDDEQRRRRRDALDARAFFRRSCRPHPVRLAPHQLCIRDEFFLAGLLGPVFFCLTKKQKNKHPSTRGNFAPKRVHPGTQRVNFSVFFHDFICSS